MPESKSRNPHHPQQQQHHVPKRVNNRKAGRAVIIGVVFFALLGMGISYFIAGEGVWSLALGAGIGAIAGYLFGHQIQETLTKK